MEALHKKVHAEAEKLVDAEFNHQRFVNEMKTDYERKVEQRQAELNHMRVGRSPRGSAEALVNDSIHSFSVQLVLNIWLLLTVLE